MKQRLTSRQLTVFVFAKEFFKENDQLPSALDIAEHFGWDRGNGHHYLQILTGRGWLERNAAGRYRFARESAGLGGRGEAA